MTGGRTKQIRDHAEGASLKFFGLPAIWPVVKNYRGMLLVMLILGTLSSVADACYPLFNRHLIDVYIAERTTEHLPRFAALYILVVLMQGVINYISFFLCCKAEIMVSRDYKNLAFQHLQTLSFSYFNQNNVGYVHARVMSDTAKIGALVSWRFMNIVWNGSYLLFILIIMLFVNLRLALFILLLVPPTAVIIMFFQTRLARLHHRIREINSVITGNFNEGITGARSIKTLVIEKKMAGHFGEDTETMYRTSVRAARYGALFISTVFLMSSIALALVLWVGGHLTIERLMLIGTLSVFMSYAVNIMEPVQYIIEAISQMIQIRVNIERLTNLLNTKSDVTDTEAVTGRYGDTFRARRENWEPLKGDVEFRDVSFRYPDGDELVLDHFDLKVPRGTNVAIVGETGAGKSTLVNLVCRFYEPTKGQVLIDGKDARERSQLWLHSNIGYVLQTPHLFSGSVRDNLRYGREDATDEEIFEALRLVSADDVVKSLPGGLDADVGEGGSMLSTGEKQLLSFARALLADPKILVLDEATSSIDTVTERKIQEAIKTVIKGRTSFVIAHRLSTVTDADIILVVRDGRIVEKGTHKELLSMRGYYHELYNQQYADMVLAGDDDY